MNQGEKPIKRVIFAILMIVALMSAAVCSAATEDDAAVLKDLLKKADKQYDAIRYSDATALGSPLAVVREGDMIAIDIPNRTIDLCIPEEELKERLDKYKDE